jgi:NADH-quinone oxidoreductase subunit L
LHGGGAGELAVQLAASVSSLLGIWIVYRAYRSPPNWLRALMASTTARNLGRLGYRGWDFDKFYQTVLVTPLVRLAHSNRKDVVDRLYRAIAALTEVGYGLLSQSQTGRVRWYAASLAGGAVVLIAISVFA